MAKLFKYKIHEPLMVEEYSRNSIDEKFVRYDGREIIGSQDYKNKRDKISIDSWIEEVKIKEFRKAPTREPDPKVSVIGENMSETFF